MGRVRGKTTPVWPLNEFFKTAIRLKHNRLRQARMTVLTVDEETINFEKYEPYLARLLAAPFRSERRSTMALVAPEPAARHNVAPRRRYTRHHCCLHPPSLLSPPATQWDPTTTPDGCTERDCTTTMRLSTGSGQRWGMTIT